MSSFAFLTNIISKPAIKVTVFPQRCLRRRLNTNQCELCVNACWSDALSLKGREVGIDESCCTGCMSCVSVCPQDVFESDYDLDELLGEFQKKKEVLVSCIRQKQVHPNEVTVPCFGILSKPLLAAISLSDCGVAIFNAAECSKCPNSDSSVAFITACKEVKNALCQVLTTDIIVSEDRKDLQQRKGDRRSYLSNIGKLASSVSKKHFTSVHGVGDRENTSRRIPHKTKIAGNLLKKSNEAMRAALLKLLGYNLQVNDNCTLCPKCKGICPTGALTIERSDQEKTLSFSHLKCSGCGLCVEFCNQEALMLTRR